jgi:hypothetical protein
VPASERADVTAGIEEIAQEIAELAAPRRDVVIYLIHDG